MRNFDIDISQNLAFEGTNEEIVVTPTAPQIQENKTATTTDSKKGGFQQGAKAYQDLIKSFTEFGADKEGYGYYEKYKDPTGKKKRVLGLDPLVFIVISFGLIIASGVTIVMLKQKK
jgi:hypothetical protein